MLKSVDSSQNLSYICEFGNSRVTVVTIVEEKYLKPNVSKHSYWEKDMKHLAKTKEFNLKRNFVLIIVDLYVLIVLNASIQIIAITKNNQ